MRGVKPAIDALDEMKTKLRLTGEEELEFAETINLLGQAMDGQEIDIQELLDKLNKLGLSADQIKQKYERAMEGFDNTNAAVRENVNAQQQNQVLQDNNSERFKGLGEQLSTQDFATEIANVAGSIGQLAFAWQSFQGLGSL